VLEGRTVGFLRGPDLMGRLGGFWERAGHYERAVAAYRDALQLDPANPETHMHLAIQYARLGEEESVRPHLARAGPVAEIPHLRNRLGIVYAARGDARAERIFRGLIRRHPDYPTARRNLAVYLRKQGRHAEAVRFEGPSAAPSGAGSEASDPGFEASVDEAG